MNHDNKKYAFRDYDPNYPSFFIDEKKNISSTLNAEIEHIGSTAVEGLGGKGIVDILVAVSMDEIESATEKIRDLGYLYMHSSGEREFFRKDVGMLRVHVHLVIKGSPEWKGPIMFRDMLRSDRALCKGYADIKRQAALKSAGDKEIYRAIKGSWIEKNIKNIT